MRGEQEGRLRQVSADGAGNPCRQGGELGYGQWQRRDVGGRDTSEPDERYGADYRILDLGDRHRHNTTLTAEIGAITDKARPTVN